MNDLNKTDKIERNNDSDKVGKSLTSKQEQFCKNIVAGMTYKDAYKNAYSTDCSDNTAYTEGYKLMQLEYIKKRLESLKKPIEDAFTGQCINARQQQIEFINERITICKDKGDEQSIIRYTDMLNKIFGVYQIPDDKPQDNKTTISKLDTSVLRKIAQAQ